VCNHRISLETPAQLGLALALDRFDINQSRPRPRPPPPQGHKDYMYHTTSATTNHSEDDLQYDHYPPALVTKNHRVSPAPPPPVPHPQFDRLPPPPPDHHQIHATRSLQDHNFNNKYQCSLRGGSRQGLRKPPRCSGWPLSLPAPKTRHFCHPLISRCTCIRKWLSFAGGVYLVWPRQAHPTATCVNLCSFRRRCLAEMPLVCLGRL
jgi:hypothetical protein